MFRRQFREVSVSLLSNPIGPAAIYSVDLLRFRWTFLTVSVCLQDTAPPRECPRGGSKKKGSGGGQTAGGGGGGGSPDSGSSSSVSSPGSSGGTSSGAGAPGGGGRPPGKSPSKTPSGVRFLYGNFTVSLFNARLLLARGDTKEEAPPLYPEGPRRRRPGRCSCGGGDSRGRGGRPGRTRGE